jgi:hypothetical protein
MFATTCDDDRQYWQARARSRRARALEQKYVWELQTAIINATTQEPRDQQRIDALLEDLTAVTGRAQQRTGV